MCTIPTSQFCWISMQAKHPTPYAYDAILATFYELKDSNIESHPLLILFLVHNPLSFSQLVHMTDHRKTPVYHFCLIYLPSL